MIQFLYPALTIHFLLKNFFPQSFDVFVTQVFENSRIIHLDYLKMFESCKRELNEGTKLSIIAEILMKDRIEQEALRRSICGFLEVYMNDERLGMYIKFFRTASRYFHISDFKRDRRGSRSVTLLMELEEWADTESRGIFLRQDEEIARARETLLQLTNVFLRELRQRWTELSKIYAELVINKVRS